MVPYNNSTTDIKIMKMHNLEEKYKEMGMDLYLLISYKPIYCNELPYIELDRIS